MTRIDFQDSPSPHLIELMRFEFKFVVFRLYDGFDEHPLNQTQAYSFTRVRDLHAFTCIRISRICPELQMGTFCYDSLTFFFLYDKYKIGNDQCPLTQKLFKLKNLCVR